MLAGLEAIRIHSGCKWTHQVHTEEHPVALSEGVSDCYMLSRPKKDENAVNILCCCLKSSLILFKWRGFTHTQTNSPFNSLICPAIVKICLKGCFRNENMHSLIWLHIILSYQSWIVKLLCNSSKQKFSKPKKKKKYPARLALMINTIKRLFLFSNHLGCLENLS